MSREDPPTPATESPPNARYVAIITDGNGRWARDRGLGVNAGHEAAADTLKARLADAAELGIEELSIYAFSTENWSRPAEHRGPGADGDVLPADLDRDSCAASGGRQDALHRAARGNH